MSIKSTRKISREDAIYRIGEVADAVRDKDYRWLESISSEHEYDVETFVDSHTPPGDVSKWTNKMLENLMDTQFYRYSMFDNYFVVDEVGDDD